MQALPKRIVKVSFGRVGEGDKRGEDGLKEFSGNERVESELPESA
jgi:hypothetical protein